MTASVQPASLRACLCGSVALVVLCGTALADPLPKIETTFDNGSVLRFYGQINKGFLTYDDGQVSETYDLIDNQSSNTRFGLTYSASFADTWKYLGTIEIQYAPFSTSNTSILQQSPPSSAYDLTVANIRKIDNQFTSETLGVFYIGQGDMASQNTAEVDLSGTTVIAKSSVQDIAGGQLIREADGTLSSIKISNAFNNYNGLGRNVRLRYDTPDFGGFTIRTSFGRNLLYRNDNEATQSAVQDQNLADISLAYKGETGDFRYEGQIAYGYKASYTVNGKETPSTTVFDGSASILHGPTGLSLTVALGEQDNGSTTGNYGFVKAGWQADLIPWGKTAFAVDYYSGLEINGSNTESESAAISVVQNITDWNTELWAVYREYSYASLNTDYDDSHAVFVGARFKF
jgi:hypothetical protein